MAKTTAMRLIELMVLKEDIRSVLVYLGKLGDFQFQEDFEKSEASSPNADEELFRRLDEARSALEIKQPDSFTVPPALPSEADTDEAVKLCFCVEDFHKKETELKEEAEKVSSAYKEALAFSNLNVSYSQLESLSFLTMRIGKIRPGTFEELKERTEGRVVLVSLDEDKTRILAASSKKSRFMLDAELKELDELFDN